MINELEIQRLRREVKLWRTVCAILFIGGTVQWVAYMIRVFG